MNAPVNVHGTAIVIGTAGLIFLGPSGSGKSAAAIDCVMSAKGRGLFSAFVSDDQVLLCGVEGRITARAAASIAGLVEVRGVGIVAVQTIGSAILHHAIRPITAPIAERMAPERESVELLPGFSLPVTRLPLLPGCSAFSLLSLLLPEILES